MMDRLKELAILFGVIIIAIVILFLTTETFNL